MKQSLSLLALAVFILSVHPAQAGGIGRTMIGNAKAKFMEQLAKRYEFGLETVKEIQFTRMEFQDLKAIVLDGIVQEDPAMGAGAAELKCHAEIQFDETSPFPKIVKIVPEDPKELCH